MVGIVSGAIFKRTDLMAQTLHYTFTTHDNKLWGKVLIKHILVMFFVAVHLKVHSNWSFVIVRSAFVAAIS